MACQYQGTRQKNSSFINYWCGTQTGLSAFVRTVLVQQATSAMIDCDGPALAAGLLAADWQVPLIGYNTVSPQLSDKSTYRTFVRIVPPYASINDVLREVFAYYNWTTAGLLTSTSTGSGASTTDSLLYTQQAITSSSDNPFSLFTQTLPANFSSMDIANALAMLSKKSRSKLRCPKCTSSLVQFTLLCTSC